MLISRSRFQNATTSDCCFPVAVCGPDRSGSRRPRTSGTHRGNSPLRGQSFALCRRTFRRFGDHGGSLCGATTIQEAISADGREYLRCSVTVAFATTGLRCTFPLFCGLTQEHVRQKFWQVIRAACHLCTDDRLSRARAADAGTRDEPSRTAAASFRNCGTAGAGRVDTCRKDACWSNEAGQLTRCLTCL